MSHRDFIVTLMMIAALGISPLPAPAFPTPLGNAFTYQGQLKQSGSASTGSFDFECKLFDALTLGTQVGTTQTITSVAVTDGLFTIDLDVGPGAFDGNDRFLQLGVRTAGGGVFTTLAPRQKLNPAPYAQFAKSSIVSGTIGNQVSFNNAANVFTGSGAGLTALNASNMATGTLGSSILLGTYSNALTFNNAANVFTGSGAGLASLNAANISSGTLGVARLPSGGAWALTSALNLDSNTLVIDAVNNRVGVGTAAPEAPLHVFEGFAGIITANANASLVLERNAANYLNILAPDANETGVLFGRPGSTALSAAGGVLFNVVPDGLVFRTGGNSTKMTITADGDVGIGTSIPSARLDVNGDARINGLTVDGAITIPVTTRSISISPAGFIPNFDNTAVVVFSGGGPYVSAETFVLDGTSVEAEAPVSLPDGAVVTQIRATVDDSSSSRNITVALRRVNQTYGSGSSTMASVTSSGSAGGQFLTDSSISSATIDNDTYYYYADVSWPKDGTLLNFWGVRITYTITTPLP